MFKKLFANEGAQLKKGLALENAGKLDEAFSAYKKAADAGSAVGMFAIGNLYLYKNYQALELPSLMPWGQDKLIPNMKEAYAWFLKAAEAGFPDAMSNVGVMLYSGRGCPKDEAEARRWLEKAAAAGVAQAQKALHDLFGADSGEHMPDEKYDGLLEGFCSLIEEKEEARPVYEALMNGTEEQLSRLGWRLAEGRYRLGGDYFKYPFPNLRKNVSCAPVSAFRCGWASAVVVNLRALPRDGAITFAQPDQVVPIWGIQETGGQVQYEGSEFGWMSERRRARVLRPAPGFRDLKAGEKDPLKYCGVDVPKLLDHLKLTEHEALFIETGEKEYSVEIGCLTGGDVKVLLRYTVDGWDQGEAPAQVTNVTYPAAAEEDW